MIGALAGDLVVLLAGHTALRLGGGRWPHRAYGVLGALGLCWLAGVAVLGAVTTLVAVLGGPTRPPPVVAPVLGLLALAGLVPRRGRGGPAAGAERRPARWAVGLGDLVCGLVAAGVAARTAALGAGIPAASNDEYALWMVRARTLSQLGRLDPRVFTDTGAAYQQQNYPLFFPSLVAWGDGWVGRPSDAAAHVAVASLLAALLATTGWAVGRLAGPLPAVAAVLLVAAMPTLLSRQSLLLMADVPLLAFGLPLALTLLLWLRRPERATLAAAAMLGAGACGTKVEGALLAGSAFLAALLLTPGRSAADPPALDPLALDSPGADPLGASSLPPGRRRGVLVAAAVAILANLPWLGYSQAHHLRNWVANRDTVSARHLRDVLPFTGHVLRGLLDRWPGAGGVVGLLLVACVVPAAALAIRGGGGRAVAFVAVVVGLDVLVLVAQYVLSAHGPPTDPTARRLLDGLLQVTVYRVALVPAGFLMIAAPLLAGLGTPETADETRPDIGSPAPRRLAWTGRRTGGGR